MKSHFLPDSTYTELRITCFNPYTEPENGIRHLWACCVPWPRTSDNLNSHEITSSLFEIAAPECPPRYSPTYIVGGSIKPMRKMSAQGKASIRRKRMEAHFRKKDPLFADQFIARELKREYYDPEAIAKATVAHEQAIKGKEAQDFQQFVEESIIRRKFNEGISR